MYVQARGPAPVAEAHVRMHIRDDQECSGLDLFLLNGSSGADACAADTLVARTVLAVAGPVVRAAVVLVH